MNKFMNYLMNAMANYVEHMDHVNHGSYYATQLRKNAYCAAQERKNTYNSAQQNKNV